MANGWPISASDSATRALSGPAKVVEIIEAETGKVVRSLKVGPSFQRMNTVAFDGLDEDVLLARVERDASQNRLFYLIERWSRVTGKVTGTVSLPVAVPSPQDVYSPHAGRLVFSADRKSLLSIPAEAGKRATVWDLAAAKPLREFESDFMPEAFFPDGRRIIGMTGSDIIVRDVTTGGVTKRWPMPDGLVSVMGNLRNNPTLGCRARPSPPARRCRACGSVRTADGWRPSASTPQTISITGPDAHDDLPLRRRVRAAPRAHPDPRRPGRFQSPRAPAPPLAFDAESHMLAVATTKSLSLFSVPQGTPLISEALPEPDTTPAGQPPAGCHNPVFTMPTGLLFARGTNRLFEAVHPSDLSGSPVGDRSGLGRDQTSSSRSSCPGT